MMRVERVIVFVVAVLLGLNLLVADAIVIKTYLNWNGSGDSVDPFRR